jgi:hypothetical protein
MKTYNVELRAYDQIQVEAESAEEATNIAIDQACADWIVENVEEVPE